MKKIRTGIGQDSHRFLPEGGVKPCLLGGVLFEGVPGFDANSDGDVILHALCNAISSVTGVRILGSRADLLLQNEGITDSTFYVQEALKTLGKQQIVHLAISLEGSRPHLGERVEGIRHKVAEMLHLLPSQVGITATTGEGLTDFGCGDGVQCICILTTEE